MKRAKHWTHSRLSVYEKCPAQYAGLHLEKWGPVEYKQSPAASRGDKIHSIMEEAIVDRTKLTGTLAIYNKYVKELKSWYVCAAEEQLALSNSWAPTGWKDTDLWWRGKMDVECYDKEIVKAKVVDWKTGNVYGTNADQIRLYAAVTMARFPSVETVEVELVYLDQKKAIGEIITRAEFQSLREDFTARASAMLTARTYPETPSADACRWCQFHAEKGGPCTKGIPSRGPLQTDSRGPRVVVEKAAPLRRRRSRPDLA